MAWLARHVVSTALVLTGLAGVAGVFTFARPEAHAARTEEVVNMTGEDTYSRAEVTKAFAAQGISLVAADPIGASHVFGDRHLGDGFTLTLFAPSAVVRFATTGPKPMYERRLGNLDVFYGGHDRRFVARIEAAVAAVEH